LEWMRGTLLTGFPWGVLGASQQGSLLVSQAASLFGVYGLSFLLSAFSAGLCALAVPGSRGRGRTVVIVLGLALPAGAGLWGGHRVSRRAPARTLTVGCVQGNSSPDPAESEGARMLEVSEELTRRAAAGGARLILWSESPSPYGLEMHERYRSR